MIYIVNFRSPNLQKVCSLFPKAWHLLIMFITGNPRKLLKNDFTRKVSLLIAESFLLTSVSDNTLQQPLDTSPRSSYVPFLHCLAIQRLPCLNQQGLDCRISKEGTSKQCLIPGLELRFGRCFGWHCSLWFAMPHCLNSGNARKRGPNTTTNGLRPIKC